MTGGGGGYDPTLFVEQPIDKNYLCSICSFVFREPIIVCKNGHTYCRSCIHSWKVGDGKNNRSCPDCRWNISYSLLNRPLQSIIMGFQVRCPAQAPEGTTIEEDSVEKEEEAEEDDEQPKSPKRPRLPVDEEDQKSAPPGKTEGLDDFEPTEARCCTWKGTLSDYLEKHKAKECKYYFIKCQLCEEQVLPAKMNDHTQNHCPHRTVACNLCGLITIRKSELDHHKQFSCRERS